MPEPTPIRSIHGVEPAELLDGLQRMVAKGRIKCLAVAYVDVGQNGTVPTTCFSNMVEPELSLLSMKLLKDVLDRI